MRHIITDQWNDELEVEDALGGGVWLRNPHGNPQGNSLALYELDLPSTAALRDALTREIDDQNPYPPEQIVINLFHHLADALDEIEQKETPRGTS